MQAPSLRPIYRVTTPRLLLRCWDPADTRAYTEALNENRERLERWGAWPAHDTLAQRAYQLRILRAQFDTCNAFTYGVFSAEDGRLLGEQVLTPLDGGAAVEIGAWVCSDSALRGVASEGTAALMRLAFQVLRVTRVEAMNAPDNDASIAVMRKLGFTHEATLRRLVDGERKGEMLWTMLADEFGASPAAALSANAQAFDALGDPVL